MSVPRSATPRGRVAFEQCDELLRARPRSTTASRPGMRVGAPTPSRARAAALADLRRRCRDLLASLDCLEGCSS